MDDLKRYQGTSSILHQALYIISKPSLNSKWSYSPETLNLGQNRQYFVPCDLSIGCIDLKNNRTSLLYYIKLCASCQSHRWIQTWVTARKRPIWVKVSDFLSRVTLKFDIWPWKTIGHLFNATSSYFNHFIAICGFKLELQLRNYQFGSKTAILFSRVTLIFDEWPWKQ